MPLPPCAHYQQHTLSMCEAVHTHTCQPIEVRSSLCCRKKNHLEEDGCFQNKAD